jgi:hypothetical protein
MTHVTIAPHVLVRNIHPSAWKVNSRKFAAFMGFSRKVASPENSSPIHRRSLGYGWGGSLPSLSSSFSFPELLLGFPRAHPSLW